MREAIGSSLLYNIVITIVIVMIAVLISSLAYSKAFKVKNRIINMIESNRGYNSDLNIDSELTSMGYKTKTSNTSSCVEKDGAELKTSGVSHDYCVYEYKTCESENGGTCNSYYKVITYMYFDIPIIGKLLKFPVSGETKVIYDTYINYE